eukprot:m.338532 g.338532  ORF g.338532 m.338532 type:complete len:827 (+) comp55734_c0_seq6:47-2527(+)
MASKPRLAPQKPAASTTRESRSGLQSTSATSLTAPNASLRDRSRERASDATGAGGERVARSPFAQSPAPQRKTVALSPAAVRKVIPSDEVQEDTSLSKRVHSGDARRVSAENIDEATREDVVRQREAAMRDAVLSATAVDTPDYEVADDFEDYDDDFEEPEEDTQPQLAPVNPAVDKAAIAQAKQAQAVTQAIKEENARAKLQVQTHERSAARSPAPQTHTALNFPTMNFSSGPRKASKATLTKLSSRFKDLQRLITLDVLTIDLLELAPMTEYEIYIKNYGKTNARQVATQSNESPIHRDIQTDEIETRSKWTQEPPSDLIGCGGDQPVDPFAVSRPRSPTQSLRLGEFLQRASQVCNVLLEERPIAASGQASKASVSFASQNVQLNTTLPILAGRTVREIQFASHSPNLLLVAYNSPLLDLTSAKTMEEWNSKGLLCVWNINSPELPQQILACESSVTCCCFSPEYTFLVFAGTKDGSVLVWDLRESPSLHKLRYNFQKSSLLIRSPSFSTDGVELQFSHQGAIQLITAMDANAHVSHHSATDPSSRASVSFQLATIDEEAVFKSWIVIELDKPDFAGSPRDLGLHPGSRIKLVRGASMPLAALQQRSTVRSTEPNLSVAATTLQFYPDLSNHFLVGLTSGGILHAVRFGERAYPHVFQPPKANGACTSVQFAPSTPTAFVAGFTPATVCLYRTSFDGPVHTWDQFSASTLLTAAWSTMRPCVFFAVMQDAFVHVWDLMADEWTPVLSESTDPLHTSDSTLQATSAALVGPQSKAGAGASIGRSAHFAVGLTTGTVNAFLLEQRFTTTRSDELAAFQLFLDRLM